jgi:spoIIIJ-associated protein
MSEPPREFFTGNSLEQAVLTAAQHYGLEPDDLSYERVERRYGFLRQRRNVVIKVDPKNPKRKHRLAGDAQPTIAEPEIDDTPQLETQHDFNLHRDAPRSAPPAQRSGAPRPGGQRQPGPRPPGPRPSGQRQPGQRGPGGPPRGQGGQRPPRPMSPAPHPRPGGPREDRGEERGQAPRRRRRRRGGGRQGGERRPVDTPVLEFIPEQRSLPPAEGPTAELASATARKLTALAGLDLQIEVLQGESELEVELSGTDQDRLFQDEGRLLLAIQHLLPRSMQGEVGESMGVRVDSQGFRSQRVASLERLAREAADEVRRQGRPKTLHSMNPSDRRTVHLALKDSEGVVTESSGEGFYKRITVRPA